MNFESATVYVVKMGNEYCRFGSYGSVKLVDHPLKATVYRRLQDAKYRLKETWIESSGKRVGASMLSVVKIKAIVVEEDPV